MVGGLRHLRRKFNVRISGEVHCFVHRNLVEDEEQAIVEKTAFGSKLWFTENIHIAALILWLGIVFTIDLNTHLLDSLSDYFLREPIGAAVFYLVFFIWPLFVNYKKLIEKI